MIDRNNQRQVKWFLTLLSLVLLPVLGYCQRVGDIDSTFNYGRGSDYQFNFGNGANNAIVSSASQANGKIIIGGSFTFYNGTSINRIARLNSDGSLDKTFNPGTGVNSGISSIIIQPDGKILIGGHFATFNGITRNRIARLNSDGSLDTTFNRGLGVNNVILNMTLQPDGKIIIGGIFTSIHGTPIYCIARLNTDGSLDASFNPGTGVGFSVYTTALQADGKIIIGGSFTSVLGVARNYLARLNSDGSLDETFNPEVGPNNYVQKVIVQPNGKIVIGGEFSSYRETSSQYIARINSDGSLDGTFNIGSGFNGQVRSMTLSNDGKIIIGGYFNSYNSTYLNSIAILNDDGSLNPDFNNVLSLNSSIETILLQPDGKILIGGSFSSNSGNALNYIARLNNNGSADGTFIPITGADEIINSTVIQPDGKIVIGGDFSTYNGKASRRIARLNSDGSPDSSFNIGTGPNSITVSAVALKADNKIIIGGSFTTYNGIIRNRLACLNTDGSLDITFNSEAGLNFQVRDIAIQPDGKILIGGSFTTFNGISRNRVVRLNSEGSLDVSFNPGTGANNYISKVILQADGKIIIGGNFTSYNGTSRNRIARLNSDGSLDNSFNPGTGASSIVNTIALQSDGKIIIGGNFTTFNGTSTNYVARLNSDGSLDNNFNMGTGTNGAVNAIYLQADGKFFLGGNFSSYNGNERNNIIRLNSDGSIDNTFEIGMGANGEVKAISLQPDGNLIIAGDFYGYKNSGAVRIARIKGCSNSIIPIISGNNTICTGGSTVLTSSSLTGNVWSTGETTQSITVTESGLYSVSVINGGCTSSISENFPTSIIPMGTWLGENSDWNNSANWCGGVPTATTDIALPSLGTLPVITGTTANCRNLTIPVGVTLNIGSDANFNLAGNLLGLGNIEGASGSSLTLNGTTAQTIKRLNVGTLILNNSAGVSLAGNVFVKNGVTLTNGILNTQAHNLILLSTASSPSETNSSYIFGNVRSNARYVGTGAGSMFGINLGSGTDDLDTVMIERTEGIALFNSNQGISHIWKIRARNQPVSGRQVTLTWNQRADNGKNLNALQVFRRPDEGGEWVAVGATQNGTSRSITVTTNSFSDWTISDNNAPLPVTLTSFTGKQMQFGNQLNWSTSSEVNNQGFTIERSLNGKTFTKIGFVKGKGTTNTKQTYQFTDVILREAFYRLLQVDFDGKTEYSNTIKVGEASLVSSLEVYPNPASDKVTVKTKGEGAIEIVNTLGQVLITQLAIETNEINVSKLTKGVYTIKFNGVSQKLVVR